MDYIDHDYDLTYKFDEIRHWYECTKCGDRIRESNHQAVCSNPTVCEICGQTNVTIGYISHEANWDVYKYDDKSHWIVCNICGQKLNEYLHDATCNNPNVCRICKEENVSIDKIIHQRVLEDVIFDSEYHWWPCKECGEEIYKAEHEFEVNVCTVCSYKKIIVKNGDSNGDGVVDGRDLLRLARYLAGSESSVDLSAADINGDGNVDGRDVLRLAKQLAGG